MGDDDFSTHDRTNLLSITKAVERVSPGGIIRRIENVHSDLAADFYSGIGMKMMTQESEIMLEILDFLVALKNVPALGIHDAVVCRASDKEYVERLMTIQYRRLMGFNPVIKSSP